jgi:DNA mismatch repair protein MSH4
LVRKIIELFGGGDGGNDDAEQKRSEGKRRTFVKPISRVCFDQTKGSEALAGIARDNSFDASVVSEYIVLSSVHAVLHYTEQSLGTTFLKNSVRLFVNTGGKNKMSIDRCTLVQLELLANAKSGKTKNSIIAAIDFTKTSVGERLLRSNIMAPPTNTDTIGMRQDLVDAFLSDKKFFYAVMQRLKLLPCLDKMITNVAMVPKRNKGDIVNLAGKKETGKKLSALVNIARKGISALINIKTTLVAIPALAQTLEERLTQISSADDCDPPDEEESTTPHLQLKTSLGDGPPSITNISGYRDHHLLRAILLVMKQSALKDIFHTVSNVFSNSTKTAGPGSNREARRRHEECFALKAESTSLMGVLRKKYIENVDEIHRLADAYAEEHGLSCSVRFSTSRGYYLVISDVSSLPPRFINAARSGRDITCTTQEVVGLNIRAQDNVQDLLLMTDSRIQEILDEIRTNYDALAALSDAIALLDMCHSFADCVTQKGTRPWCRPIMTTGSNGIVIRNGRYLGDIPNFRNATNGAMGFVENDTYTTDESSVTIITGINGSGESLRVDLLWLLSSSSLN